MPVTHLRVSAEMLPFDDAWFDCVVTTWTLCTIPDVQSALRGMQRVLKPAGQYLFLEHGRSDNPRTAWWQDRLNPLQRCLAAGCNLNRPISRLITEAGFEITMLERYLLAGLPCLFSKMYRGIARRATSDTR
jgi:ubiquinone/menaquinone biosynthesis C-methylase UbiE